MTILGQLHLFFRCLLVLDHVAQYRHRERGLPGGKADTGLSLLTNVFLGYRACPPIVLAASCQQDH